MQKQGSEDNFIDDGFQSDDQDRTEVIKLHTEGPNEQRLHLQQHMIKYIPPPQEIKSKSYSLHPDIITGWAPKIVMPKPIPLSFPFQPLSRILKAYEKTKNYGVRLKYLGPRFDNTYSAWKLLISQFPYKHLGERKVTVTDRKYELRNQEIDTSQVRFDSLFESGNLDAVFQVGQFEFDCFMRVDTNTKGHLQWFYFKMENLQPKTQYRLNICNFQKAKTLYLRGMKPYVYSSSQYKKTSIGWHQRGQNVEYSKKIPKSQNILFADQSQECQPKYFTLSFTISTGNEAQDLEIAYCPPYTWTRLNLYLNQLTNNCKNRDIIAEGQLCLSLGGFKIPLLTITSQASQAQSQFKKNNRFKNKSLIFVNGRIHPGECNGSYMMQGFINWICGHSLQAAQLRNRYVFKIVPMLNPDGVIIGNYRTGLSGKDFNREFTNPDPVWFVQINELKLYLQRCKWIYQKKFNFFLDFHGHTVKKNIFAYGPEFPLTHAKYYECRLFPKLLARKTQLFRYYSCVFKVAAAKSTTARAILLRQYGIPFTYTLQASNGCFYNQQQNEDVAFDPSKWLFVGQKVGQTFYEYWSIAHKFQIQSLRRKKEKEQRQKNKWQKMKRIQSSNERRNHRSLISNKQKQTIFVEQKIKDITHESVFADILNEIKNQKQKQSKKNSDDELSQGKSDSENQQDDIEANTLKSFLLGVKKPTKRIEIIKYNQSQQKKQRQQKLISIVKKSSFITQFNQNPLQIDNQRYSPIEKRKKQVNYRKKIYTVSSIPSPTREQYSNNPKIVNLSFILNPVSIASSMIAIPDRRQRQRTQVSEVQYQSGQINRQQPSDSFRKTYLSLQREALKKEMIKRISLYGKPLSRQAIKLQEVVGKRILNEN